MMRRHFVLVTSSFPIRGDGSEAAGSFVADLAASLAREIPVRVVAPGPEARRERWSDGIDVIRYAAPAFPLSTLKPWRPGHLRWISRVLRGGQAATHEALDEGASHALALWGLPCGEWVRQAARSAHIGYSTWLLGSDVWSLGKVPVLRGFLARVIRESAHVYADGHQLADDARRIAGRPIEFLPSTRAMGSGRPAPTRTRPPYRLLFLGRWHPNKGVDLLLDALARLDADDWSLIECVEIQGGGPMEALVRARVASLRAAGRPVEAGDYLHKADAEAAMVRADWVLVPSRIESIPVVFSDAMKMARPVVAMCVGDLPRLIVQEQIGVCSDDVSADAYAAALRKALRQAPMERASALAAAAAPFSLDGSIVPKLLGLLFAQGQWQANR
jgi:glycosyltransferase involved in cell wall biosynthesis